MQDPDFDERLGPDHPRWHLDSPIHLSRYFHAAEHVRGKRVLDAGTGLGYGASILKASGAIEVQAIDIDATSIEKARKRFAHENLEYLVDDCEQLANVRGPFDVICNFENIEHLNRPEAFLENAARLLNDDGTFFCSTPDREVVSPGADKPSNPFHIKEWSIDEFRAMLGPYFEEVDVQVQIENHSVGRLREVTDLLVQHLNYLCSTPIVRASRVLGKLFGQKPPAWDKFYNLPSLVPADFPIVPEPIAPLLGSTLVHYAICRKPRRA